MDDLRTRIEHAMAALQAQRATMGDELLALAMAPLKAKLNALQDDAAVRQLRHATVLFMDIVGSTSLSESLDPEDVGEVMDGALERFTALVEQQQGRVLQYAGDSLLALFGAATSHEDDAERAVRAGLAILDEGRARAAALEARHGRVGFNVRVGVHTGDVLVGGGVDGENSVRGQTVNIAARMEQTAPPGALRISQDTYRHVRGKFKLQEQPPLQVKGCSEPLRSYLIQGLQLEPDWMAMRGVDGIVTPLIGRDGQLARLQALWAATSGAPQAGLACTTLVGDAGLGKSRLVAEFRRGVGPLPGAVRWLEAHSAEQHMRRPYHMLRVMLAAPIGMLDSDPEPQARARWLHAVAPLLGGQSNAAVLGHLLGLDFSAEPELRSLRSEARQLRDRAFFHAGQLLAAWATHHGPLIAWLDDLHWVDDGTLDFFEYLMRSCADLPLLLLAPARPSFYDRRPGWDDIGQRQHRVDLMPLAPQDASQLAQVLLKRLDAPPQPLHALLTERAEGNPFYMEELVNMLLDRHVIQADTDGWQYHPERLQALKLPTTLIGVLQARLDALDEGTRRTAQLASVVGFRFWDDALLALGAPSAQALKGLVERELAAPHHPSSLEGAIEYAFKHHTVHQVAYDSVLKRHKPGLHAKVAHWLLGLPGSTPFALVAEHAERGGERALAADCWQRAAEAAASGYANAQGLAHAERALALSAPDDLPRHYALTLLRCRVLEVMSDRDRLGRELDALAALADATGDVGRKSEALCRQARNHYDRGDAAVALDIARQALLAAPDLAVDSRALVARCLLRLGRHAEAEAESLAALALARSLGDLANEGRILNDLGMLTLERGDPGAAALLYERALANHQIVGNQANEGGTLNNLGYVALMLGDYAASTATFAQARALFARIGHRQNEGIALVNLAMSQLLQGNAADAKADALSAVALLQATADRWAQGAALRVIGQATLAQGDTDGAVAAFTASRDLFHDLHLPHLALEAIAGLAAVALARGQSACALDQVESILAQQAAGISLEGTEEPVRIQLVCCQVLAAAADKRADNLLREAREALLKRAERITDPARRRTFLQNVPYHRELLAAWPSTASLATGY